MSYRFVFTYYRALRRCFWKTTLLARDSRAALTLDLVSTYVMLVCRAIQR
jgi:hypothetical protein